MTQVAVETDLTRATQSMKNDGYTIFKKVLDESCLELLRALRAQVVQDWQYSSGSDLIPDAVGAMLERSPRAILPIVSHPLILGFSEVVMGPVVQLDSAVLAGDPPHPASEMNAPVMWHRDRFGSVPPAQYVKPASIVFICYLQDMTPEMGQLRVIPGSHQSPHQLAANELHSEIENERRLEIAAGDIVALHHNILHSGGVNTSSRERRFFGFIHNASMLRQEDNFDGPNCRALRESAQRCQDRRLLRLLGADPLIFPRQNSGFTGNEQEDWKNWIEDDRKFAAERQSESNNVAQVRVSTQLLNISVDG